VPVGAEYETTVCLADVEKICRLRDDVYRNRWITLAYHDISTRLARLIDPNASWCTFSTWSSRTIGENLRLDEPNRRVEELLAEYHWLDPWRRPLLNLQYRLRARSHAVVPRLLAVGNRLVFHEIGYEVTRFLDWCQSTERFDADGWRQYESTIQAYPASDIFPAADLADLRRGLECYYQAQWATDRTRRAELVLLGNLRLAVYEQHRVDVILKAALDPFPDRFVKVADVDPHQPPGVALLGSARPWAQREEAPLLRAVADFFAVFMTRFTMTLELPFATDTIEPLLLGTGVPRPPAGRPAYPAPLDSLHDPEFEQLWSACDRSGPTHAHRGARNWTRFSDRMNVIANLFRAAQTDVHLYRDLTDQDERIRALDLSDQALDALRGIGDPLVDGVIAAHCRATRLEPRRYVKRLIDEGLDDLANAGAERPALPAWADNAEISRGQRFFRAYGLEVAAALFTASLPRSYTAARGAQVLATTAALVSDTSRRVAETGRMLLDIMGPADMEDPLAPRTTGYEAILGVRLFHAAIRYMILADASLDWDVDRLGVPINQEDLLGTLAAFTVQVIESLDKMGIPCSVADRDAYFHFWLVVGHLIGIDYDKLYPSKPTPTRLPLTYREMQMLATIIFDRNQDSSQAGAELMAALSRQNQAAMPPGLKPLPAALTRRLIGSAAADLIAVPRSAIELIVAGVVATVDSLVSPVLHTGLARRVSGNLTRQLYGAWIVAQRGRRPPWRLNTIPKEWQVVPQEQR
jgi:hypothetical protein